MKKLRLFFLGVLILVLSSLPVPAQEKHWLQGTWKGEIMDFKGAGGPVRTMNVLEVGADGTAQAAWGSGSAASVGNVKVTVNGDVVTIMPTPKTRADLKRVGDRLEGTFTAANGRSYPFQLSRVLAYRFAGQVMASGRNCTTRTSEMQVEQVGDSVKGYLESPNGRASFAGKMEGTSFQAKRISSTNATQTFTGTMNGDEMTVGMESSDSPCTFKGTLKKQS